MVKKERTLRKLWDGDSHAIYRNSQPHPFLSCLGASGISLPMRLVEAVKIWSLYLHPPSRTEQCWVSIEDAEWWYGNGKKILLFSPKIDHVQSTFVIKIMAERFGIRVMAAKIGWGRIREDLWELVYRHCYKFFSSFFSILNSKFWVFLN